MTVVFSVPVEARESRPLGLGERVLLPAGTEAEDDRERWLRYVAFHPRGVFVVAQVRLPGDDWREVRVDAAGALAAATKRDPCGVCGGAICLFCSSSA